MERKEGNHFQYRICRKKEGGTRDDDTKEISLFFAVKKYRMAIKGRAKRTSQVKNTSLA